jgi:hypothetical protein
MIDSRPPRSLHYSRPNIGAGETRTSLQWVDLFDNWESGIEQIAAAVGAKSERSKRVRTLWDPDISMPLGTEMRVLSKSEELMHLGLTQEKVCECIDITKYRPDRRFQAADIDRIVFSLASLDQLTMVPRDEFHEEWSYERHLVEIVSLVNRTGTLLVDVVPHNIREHPYDACLSIVSRDEGVAINDMVRNLGEQPTAVVVCRWQFDGSREFEELTLEIVRLPH